MRKVASCLVALAVVLTAAGCSLSESSSALSKSSSDIASSASSSLEWSSDSSASSSDSSASRRERYEEDVRDYTEAYVRSNGDVSKFKNGLAGIAAKHGVTNWEADDATWVGIGAGLKKGGATASQLAVYQANVADGDAAKAAAMRQGFDEAK